MNQTQPYMDVHQSHMSGGQPHAPPPVSAGGLSHYQQYQQPPLLQHAPGSYSPAPNTYGQYGYANGVNSPQSTGHPVSTSLGSQVPAQLLPLPAMTPGSQPPPGPGGIQSGQGYPSQSFDTTGQVAPPGMKPRVTATLWEDEGSLCFQVEAKGVCVARREDNHFINGTKLLNVAGMTRGRRDGILKSEKLRHVVKIGPMHLKGVWIPYDRALDFANKEKITEMLYPLFVHNIGALLYHPTNQSRTNAVMAAAERRRADQNQQQQIRHPQGSQPPSLHHHHSMNTPIGSHITGPPHSIAPHPGAGRPGLDRAHTFPTPPTSASSIMGIGNQGSSYEWGGQGIGGVQSTQPLSNDTGLSNAHSMPTTPATTPPGSSLQSMHQYSSGQNYDSSRSLYSAAPSQQAQYASQPDIAQQNMARFGQPMQSNPYIKNEMGPPSTRAPGSGPESEHHIESKVPDAINTHGQGNEPVGHGTGEEEAEHEHDTDYAHHNNAAYNTNRGPYTYAPGPSVGSLSGEHPHLSPEMSGSPSQQNGSGRATPRTSTTSQSQWAAGYSTPPRTHQPPPSSNLYNPMSDTRGTAPNGSSGSEGYPSGSGLATMQTGYASQHHQASLNGSSSSNKRLRDVDDDEQDRHSRPTSRGPGGNTDVDGMKRRKTMREDSAGGPVASTTFDRDPNGSINRARPATVQRRR